MPFSVGDRVSANFHGEGDYFPGVIVKCRPDGTYDIDYDDGDKELRVTESNMSLIGEDELDNTLASVDNNKDVTMTSSLDVNEVSQFNDTTATHSDARSEDSDDPFGGAASMEDDVGDDILELSQDSVLSDDKKFSEQRNRGASDDRDSLDISASSTPAPTPATDATSKNVVASSAQPASDTRSTGGNKVEKEERSYDEAAPHPSEREESKDREKTPQRTTSIESTESKKVPSPVQISEKDRKTKSPPEGTKLEKQETAQQSEQGDCSDTADVQKGKKDKEKSAPKPWKLFSRGKGKDKSTEEAPIEIAAPAAQAGEGSTEEDKSMAVDETSKAEKGKEKSKKPWKKLFGGKSKDKGEKSSDAPDKDLTETDNEKQSAASEEEPKEKLTSEKRKPEGEKSLEKMPGAADSEATAVSQEQQSSNNKDDDVKKESTEILQGEPLKIDKTSARRKIFSRKRSDEKAAGDEVTVQSEDAGVDEVDKNKERSDTQSAQVPDKPEMTNKDQESADNDTISDSREEGDDNNHDKSADKSESVEAQNTATVKRPFQRRSPSTSTKTAAVTFSDVEIEEYLSELQRALQATHKPLSAMLLIVEQYIKTKQLNLFQPISLRLPEVKILLQQLLPNTPGEKIIAFSQILQQKHAVDADTIDLQPWLRSLSDDWQPTMSLMQRLLGQALSSLISVSMNPDAPVSLRRVYEALYAYPTQSIAGSLISMEDFTKAMSSLGLPFMSRSDIELLKHHYDYACISIDDISLLVEHLLDVPSESSNPQAPNATLSNLITILTSTSASLKWSPAQIKQGATDLLSGNNVLIPKLVHGAVAVDTEGTGALSADMLTKLFCTLGIPVTSLQANQFIKEYAQDAPNGTIDVDILMNVLNVDTNSFSVADTAKEASVALYATASQIIVLLINTLLPPIAVTSAAPPRRLKRRRLDAKREDNGSSPVKVYQEPEAATIIQKVYRGKRQRKLQKKQNIAATSIQRIVRGRRTQRDYLALRQRVLSRKAEELERYKRLRRIQEQERELHLLLALPSSKYHSLENMKRNSKAKVIQRSWRKKKNLQPPVLLKGPERDVNETMKKANDIVNRLMDIGSATAPVVSKREASSTDLMRVWDSIRAKTKTPENFGASARRKYQNYYATKQSADVIYNEYRSRREAKEEISQPNSVSTCTLLAKQLSAPPSLDEAYKLLQEAKSVTPTTSPSKDQLSPNSYKAKRQLRVDTGVENEPTFPLPYDSFFNYLPTNNIHEAAINHVEKTQALGSKWHWSWVPGPGSTVIDIRDYDCKPLDEYSRRRTTKRMGSKTSIYTVFTSVDDAESSLAWAMYASTVTQNQPDTKLVKELSKSILKGKQKRQLDSEEKYKQLLHTRNSRAEAILKQGARATAGYRRSRSMLVRSAPHPHIAATKIQQWYRSKLQREETNRHTAENRVMEALKVLITELRATDVTTDALQSMMLNLGESSKPVSHSRSSRDAVPSKVHASQELHSARGSMSNHQTAITPRLSAATPRQTSDTPRATPRNVTETPRAAAMPRQTAETPRVIETPHATVPPTPRGILMPTSHSPRPPTTPRASDHHPPGSPESSFSPATPRAPASTPKYARFQSPETPQSAFTPLSYPSPYTPLHYISSPSQSASEFPTMSSIAEHINTSPSALANLQHVLDSLKSEDWATRSMIEILITSPPSEFDKNLAFGLLKELCVTYGPLPLLRFIKEAGGHTDMSLGAALPLTECIYAIVELCHVSGLFPEIHDPDSDTAKDKIISMILFFKFQANVDGCIDSLSLMILFEELWCDIVPEHGASYIQEINDMRFQIMLKAKHSVHSDGFTFLRSLLHSNRVAVGDIIQSLHSIHINIAPVTAQDAIRIISWHNDAEEIDIDLICEYFGVPGMTFRSVQMLLRALNITPPKSVFTQSQFLQYMDTQLIPLGEYEKRLLFHILQREGGGGADMKHLGEVKSGFFLPAVLKT